MTFDWSRLGDVEVGRENLGTEMPVIVYRLLQYTMKDELTERYGAQEADDILRAAGLRAGMSFAANALAPCDDFNAYVAEVQSKLRELKIGIMRIEKADLEKLELTLTLSEDLDCSGLPVMGETVCVYDEGFIAGILEHFVGKPFDVKEIDCWATGDRTCRFVAKAE